MKILFSESSPNLGGQELQLLQQMIALGDQGVAVQLACHADSGIAGRAAQLSLPATHVRFRNALDVPSILRMARLIRDLRPDAVVSHSGHDADVCAFAARLTKNRPTLIRVRTYQPGIPKAWTYNRAADRTLVPSEDMRRCILRNPAIDPARIHVLYPIVPFDELATLAHAPLLPEVSAWLAHHPGPVVVHAAMLRPEKGHAFMLDVIARLRHLVPDVRYVMAGDGAERKAIERRIASLALHEHVLLAGMVAPVAPLLARAQVVVMPSLVEPLGMAQIEALGLGVPVIGSRVGGIPETIADKKTGLLLAAGDVDAWVDALHWALAQPEAMHAMAKAGQAEVCGRFSVKANIERFVELVTSARGLRDADKIGYAARRN